MKKIIYLTCIENILFSGVLRGQAIELLKTLKKTTSHLELILVALIPIHNYVKYHKRKKQLSSEFRDIGIRFIPIPIIFLTRDFYIRSWLLPFYIIQAVPIMLAVTLFLKANLIHARSYPASLAGAFVKKLLNIKLVFDMKGLYVDEGLMLTIFKSNSLDEKLWRKMETWLVQKADVVIGVSPGFRTFLKQHPDDNKFEVVPCSVDTAEFYGDENERKKYRKRFKLEKRWVVVISGSLGAWTTLQRIITIFERIRSVNQNAFLMILTQTLDPAIKKALSRLGQENFAIFNLAPEEVANMLRIADFALLVREKNAVNEVGLTVKFGEYLASGIPVLVTETAGDAARLVRAYNCGIVIADENDPKLEQAVKDLIGNRKTYQSSGFRLVKEYLSLPQCAKKIIAIYEKCITLRYTRG